MISKIPSESKKKTKPPIVDELETANTSLFKSLEGVLGKVEELKAEDSKIDLQAIMGDMIEVSLPPQSSFLLLTLWPG